MGFFARKVIFFNNSSELLFFNIEKPSVKVSTRPPLLETIGKDPLEADSIGRRPRGSSQLEQAIVILDSEISCKASLLEISPSSTISLLFCIFLLGSDPTAIPFHVL